MMSGTTARLSALSAQVAALATVGAILGVAALVVIGGVIFGPGTVTQVHVLEKKVLTITAGDDLAAPGRARSLTNADVDAIAREVPDVRALSRAVSGIAPVVAAGQERPLDIQGVDPSFAQVTSDAIAQGTFFTSQDASAANRVAVLGPTLANQLFQSSQAAIGATIRIRNVPFTVIGVSENPDDTVLIPFQTGQVRLFGATALDAVFVQLADPNRAGGVSQEVQQLLRQRHQVRAGQPDGFTIRARPQPAAAGVGATLSLVLGQAVDLARQYSCEAKGLCARVQP